MPSPRSTRGDGQAATSDSNTSAPELIDLATGDRTFLEFALPNGTPYRPFVVLPDGEALWTLGPDRAITRWVDGEVMSSVVLPGDPVGGEPFDDRWAVITTDENGEPTTHLVDLDPVEPAIDLSLNIANAVAAVPALDGGMHVLDTNGTMLTFDDSGARMSEIETGLETAWALSVDPASGRLAIASSLVGAVIVDPATGEVQQVSTTEAVVNVGFARNGQYLALTSQDGTVRLWDVER